VKAIKEGLFFRQICYSVLSKKFFELFFEIFNGRRSRPADKKKAAGLKVNIQPKTQP